jgi:hypothetical protein
MPAKVDGFFEGIGEMETGLIPNLLGFMKEEKIKMKLQKKSDSEFWLESPDKSVTAKFVINVNAREILYDVFSSDYDVHLEEETVKNVEAIDFAAEERRKWNLAEAAEDIWLILDKIKLWTRDNRYEIKEHVMI